MPSDRIHILKSKNQLEQLDGESDDVFQKGLLDRYAARPYSLENTTLSDFGSLYQTRYASENEDSISEINNDEQTENDSKTITLLNSMGTMRKRKRRAIIRSPRFSKQKHPENFSIVYLCCMFLGDLKKTTCTCHIKHTKLIFIKNKMK